MVRTVRAAAESAKMATKIAAMRKPSVWNALIGTQDVACAADGMDQFDRIAAIHLAAQPAHMGFHDIGAGIEMQLPDILQQHAARDHPAGIAQHIFQELELL